MEGIPCESIPKTPSLQLSELKGISKLGVSWPVFFKAYISKNATSRNPFPEVCASIEEAITHFVKSLEAFSIYPTFVFDGFINNFISYSLSVLQDIAIKALKGHSISVVLAPTENEAKLSKMLQNKEIDSIFSDERISHYGIKSWISYIDLNTMRADFSSTTEEIENLCQQTDEKISRMQEKLINCICSGVLTPPRIPRPPTGPAQTFPLISLPRNCITYLNEISAIILSIFRVFAGDFAPDIIKSNGAPEIDEFVPLLLRQNQINMPIEVNETIFSSVLAAQNIVSRSFTTLFETMQSISSGEPDLTSNEDIMNRVIVESTRRFLTAHEYIAPGGGLSPWGRALLNTNAGNDICTITFIEMVRADVMDAEVDTVLAMGVGVTDIVERTFMFFPTKTKPPVKENPEVDTFYAVARIIMHALKNLFEIITADTYYSIAKNPSIEELKSVMKSMGFAVLERHTTGALMRFLLEASEDSIEEFIDNVDDYEMLKKDVKDAFRWWNDLQRGTKELKQRSLKPNSRVSNLKNFLILFECADQFVQKRMGSVCELLDI